MINQHIKTIKYLIAGFVVSILLLGSMTVVSAGQQGVIFRLGALVRVIDSGLHFKLPFIESVTKVDIKTQKEQVSTQAASKDLQIVQAIVALNYNLFPDKVGSLLKEIGVDYKDRIIDPAIQEAVKSSTANYTAEELITKRELVREEIKAALTERLAKEYIRVTEVSIVDFDFSESFNQAIEKKVTAEQDALAAKNKLEQVKFEGEQRLTQARAEAEAIRIQAQAITQQGGREYVSLKAVEKWNGVLPAQMFGETVPFINVNGR